MITFYDFTHRFKRSMLEITSDTDYKTIKKYLDPLQKEKLPDNVKFKVAVGEKTMTLFAFMNAEKSFILKGLLMYCHNLLI